MCDDNKFVDTEIVCACGRPVVKMVEGTLVCAANDCAKRAVTLKDKKIDVVQQEFDAFGEGSIYCGH